MISLDSPLPKKYNFRPIDELQDKWYKPIINGFNKNRCEVFIKTNTDYRKKKNGRPITKKELDDFKLAYNMAFTVSIEIYENIYGSYIGTMASIVPRKEDAP